MLAGEKSPSRAGGEIDRERAGAGVSRASSHGVRRRHRGCYPHGGGCSTAALEPSAGGAAARAGAPTLQLSADPELVSKERSRNTLIWKSTFFVFGIGSENQEALEKESKNILVHRDLECRFFISIKGVTNASSYIIRE